MTRGIVAPAQAGVQVQAFGFHGSTWIPAFAGMTLLPPSDHREMQHVEYRQLPRLATRDPRIASLAGPLAARSRGAFPIALAPAAQRSWTDASFHERALAILQRAEGLIRGDRRADLVIVPGTFRLGGLFRLEQICRMDLAAVGANHALAEQRIIGRHLLHLGDDLGAVI